MGNDSKLAAEALAQRIAALSPERRLVLDQFLRRNEGPAAESAIASGESSSIPRRISNDELPLSFAQQRIWFLDQFAPGSPSYNLDNALRIRFPLSLEALERS